MTDEDIEPLPDVVRRPTPRPLLRVLALVGVLGVAVYAGRDYLRPVLDALGVGGISGTYVNAGDGMVRSISFDAEAQRATMAGPAFAMLGGRYTLPYRESSTHVYITEAGKGDAAFQKVGDALVSDIKLYGDRFVRAGSAQPVATPTRPEPTAVSLRTLAKAVFTAEKSRFAESEQYSPASALFLDIPSGVQLDVRLGTVGEIHPKGSWHRRDYWEPSDPAFLATLRDTRTGECFQITEGNLTSDRCE